MSPIKLYCDNESVVKIANNSVQHDRTKHVEIDMNFLEGHLERKTIELPHVSSEDQMANMLMKAVCGGVFEWFLDKLGMLDIHSPT